MDPGTRARHVDELCARLRRLEADVVETACDADALRRLMFAEQETIEDSAAYARLVEMIDRRAQVQAAQLHHEQEYLVGAWIEWRTVRGWLGAVALAVALIVRRRRRKGS